MINSRNWGTWEINTLHNLQPSSFIRLQLGIHVYFCPILDEITLRESNIILQISMKTILINATTDSTAIDLFKYLSHSVLSNPLDL